MDWTDPIVWTAAGGLITAVVALGGLLWRIRSETESKRDDARRVATEASTAAVGNLKAALDSQSSRLDSQDVHIADLTTRLTEVDGRHTTAVRHIAERERYAVITWIDPADRPAGLPFVPTPIVSDLVLVDPGLVPHEPPPIVDADVPPEEVSE